MATYGHVRILVARLEGAAPGTPQSDATPRILLRDQEEKNRQAITLHTEQALNVETLLSLFW